MIATLDAVIFVSVIAVVAMTLINTVPDRPEGISASEISEDLAHVTVGSDSIIKNSGNKELSLYDAAVLSMMRNDTTYIKGYIESMMKDILKDRYGYTLTIECNGKTLTVGNGGDDPLSEFKGSFNVMGKNDANVHLMIYGSQ